MINQGQRTKEVESLRFVPGQRILGGENDRFHRHPELQGPRQLLLCLPPASFLHRVAALIQARQGLSQLSCCPRVVAEAVVAEGAADVAVLVFIKLRMISFHLQISNFQNLLSGIEDAPLIADEGVIHQSILHVANHALRDIRNPVM